MNALPPYLLPDGAEIDASGRLMIGGCDTLQLAERFGTPLFVYDEQHLRARCREAVEAFPDGVSYATKAFLCGAMAKLAHEEGMHLDVASDGEMFIARSAGVPMSSLVLHGNNKSESELEEAIAGQIGRIVVDSFDEIARLERLALASGAAPVKVLLRITPGVEAHTHEFVRTGQEDSKFGFGVASGAAERALQQAVASPALEMLGIHVHIGSQIFTTDSFVKAIDVVAPLVNRWNVAELCVGGGLGVAYVDGEHAPTLRAWGKALREACRNAGIKARITAEPGRSIVANAALTLYRVGTVKTLPGVRTYVSVDGGMSDNPRPVLYGSGYEVFLPRAAAAARPRRITLVGKHCESGDILVKDGQVPDDLQVGDIISTPVTGAYGCSMGSNYNAALRPAVVFARLGEARLVVRRETHQDLVARYL